MKSLDELSLALAAFEREGGVVAVKNVMAATENRRVYGVKIYIFLPEASLMAERDERTVILRALQEGKEK